MAMTAGIPNTATSHDQPSRGRRAASLARPLSSPARRAASTAATAGQTAISAEAGTFARVKPDSEPMSGPAM